MARRTHVVVSTAGPYMLCGTPVVGACVAAGTDYVDINGETAWVRQIIDSFDEAATANGTLIVPNCGYTVPSDLGSYFTALLLAEHHGVQAQHVQALMQFNGRLSGGTMSTGILLDSASAELQRARRNPFLLGGEPRGGPRPEDADPDSAVYESSLRCWTAPFWMADISSRVVRRSSELFRTAEHVLSDKGRDPPAGMALYAPDFGYREAALAKDEGVARNMALPTPVPERRQRLVDRGKLPSPGQGPSEEIRARSWFRLFFVGSGAKGALQVLSSVQGGDPGYDETSKMVAEAAMLLAQRRETLPMLPRGPDLRAGGVVTPAFAFGAPLLDKLQATGIAFQCHATAPGRIADELEQLVSLGAPLKPPAPPTS